SGGVVLAALAPRGESRAAALATGSVTGAFALLLLAHGLLKRLRPRRLRESAKTKASAAPAASSRTAAFLRAHVVFGLLSPIAVLAHAGGGGSAAARALALSYWLCFALGLGALFVYRVLPARLTRLERTLVLPEHAAQHRAELEDRLHTAVSGGGPVLKKLMQRVVLPYLHSPWAMLTLLVSGRSLAEEEARLSARVHRLLDGRGGREQDAISAALGTAVELRARLARMALERVLRASGPLHALSAAIFLALLVLHVIGVWR
ncbi:MAG TPA: hypothetical protein VGP93_06915, partial [Polyangiaceae bacterium]|nr:hypothetical protein [Polyangiaceae bacterium]